jgi:alkyl hydroperoxide reductase subunit AhpC
MPLVTSKAVPFKAQAVIDGDIKTVTLEELMGGKWLVLFFYPLDFTFVCPTEITAYSDAAGKFREAGANIAAVSVDSAYSHLAWMKVPRDQGGLGKIDYPLIADLNKDIARSFDVLNNDGVALRGLFIIDPKGIIRHATVNDLGVGRNVDETLRLLKAFQFHLEHGEVCPANWNPGDQAMKPDPKGSQTWFKKHAG